LLLSLFFVPGSFPYQLFGMSDAEEAKRWERTNTANLWELAKTGGYCARAKASGKEKGKRLKTKLSPIAKSHHGSEIPQLKSERRGKSGSSSFTQWVK
jgi:hypothetical protein